MSVHLADHSEICQVHYNIAVVRLTNFLTILSFWYTNLGPQIFSRSSGKASCFWANSDLACWYCFKNLLSKRNIVLLSGSISTNCFGPWIQSCVLKASTCIFVVLNRRPIFVNVARCHTSGASQQCRQMIHKVFFSIRPPIYVWHGVHAAPRCTSQ